MTQFETMQPAGMERGDTGSARLVPQWVGVVSIVIGILGLLCWGGSAAMTVAASSLQGTMEGAFEPSAAHRAVEFAGYFAGVVLGIWLIVAGSGIAADRQWGRGAVRIWAIIRLVVAAIGLGAAFLWMDEVVAASQYALEQQAAQAAEAGATEAESPEITGTAIQAITIAFVCLQTAGVSIWPIVVLVVTRRRAGA